MQLKIKGAFDRFSQICLLFFFLGGGGGGMQMRNHGGRTCSPRSVIP